MSTAEISPRSSIYDNFEKAARGELEGHVWRSRTHPGILLDIIFVEPGTLVDRQPKEYWERFVPYYDGLISPEEARQRAEDMKRSFVELDG